MVYQRIHICHVIVFNRHGSNVAKMSIDITLKDKNILFCLNTAFFLFTRILEIFLKCVVLSKRILLKDAISVKL